MSRRKTSYETAEEIDKRIDALIDMIGLELVEPDELMDGLSKSTDNILQETDNLIQEVLEEMEKNGDFILDESFNLDEM